MPITSTLDIFCLNMKMVITVVKIISACPTALTGAANCKANAENQQAVDIAAKKPAAKPTFHSLSAAMSSFLLYMKRYKQTIIDCPTTASAAPVVALTKNPASGKLLIAALKPSTLPAKAIPHSIPIRVA